MAGFDSVVNPPGGASFAPQPLSFAGFGQWAADDPYNRIFERQKQQANQQALQAGWQQGQLAQAFPNGLPMKDGVVDYGQIANVRAKFGDLSGAMQTQQQQPAPLSPLLGGQGAPNVDATTAQLIKSEGTGKNPSSSADGIGQFVNKTWTDSIKKYFPNLAEGRTDAQILEMRKIDPLAARVTQAFKADNEEGLAKAGLPVTPATAKLAHFAGLTSAIKVLRADPNTPVDQILSVDAMKANKFLRGMTARDLVMWASREMQGPAMTAQNAGQPSSVARVRIQQQGGGETQMASAVPGDLPPSANAGTPAPQQQPMVQPQQQQVQSPPQPAIMAGGQPQPPAPVQPPAPPAAPQQPLVPQEPLPQGYKVGQEMQAVQALRMAAAQAARDRRPGAASDAARMDAWADRIEAGLKPISMRPGEVLVDPRTSQPLFSVASAQQARQNPKVISNLVEGIASGKQPPKLTGLYGLAGPVRSGLEEAGFDLSKAQLEYSRAEKQIQALNGPQMTRYVGLATSVDSTIDEVKRLSGMMENSGIPLLNKSKLQTYIQLEGNSENGQLAARYLGAVNTLKEEFANLAQGGYAPTEPVWKLANTQINENYGVKEMGASLDEIQRLIRYRIHAIPGLDTMGPGAANRYTGETGSSAMPKGSGGKTTAPAPAIAALKADPSLSAQFEAKYGAGSAKSALGN